MLSGGSYWDDPWASKQACEGYEAVKAMHAEHLRSGGEPIDLRGFARLYVRLPASKAWAALYRHMHEQEARACEVFDKWAARIGAPWAR